MTRGWALALCTGLAVLGCAPQQDQLYPPVAPPGAKTRLVAIIHDGTVDAWVEDAALELVKEIKILEGGQPSAAQAVHLPASVEVAYFSASVAELRLRPGPQQLDGDPSEVLHAAPLRAFRAELAGRSGNRWEDAGWTTLLSSQLRLSRSTPCVGFEPFVHPLPEAFDMPWGVRLPNDRVLAQSDRQLLTLGLDGSVEELSSPDVPRGFRAKAAFADNLGNVWLGAQGGQLWRSPLSADLQPSLITTVDTSTTIERIAGDPDRPDEELYVLTSSGTLAGVAQGRVRVLFVFSGRNVGASLIWLGREHALAAWSDDSRIVEVRGSEVAVLPPNGPDGVIALGALHDGTWLSARPGGVIEHHLPGRIETVDRGGRDVAVFHARPDGFFFAREYGFLRQWVKGFGLCPNEAPLVGGSVLAMIPVGDSFILLEHQTTGGGAFGVLQLR